MREGERAAASLVVTMAAAGGTAGSAKGGDGCAAAAAWGAGAGVVVACDARGSVISAGEDDSGGGRGFASAAFGRCTARRNSFSASDSVWNELRSVMGDGCLKAQSTRPVTGQSKVNARE